MSLAAAGTGRRLAGAAALLQLWLVLAAVGPERGMPPARAEEALAVCSAAGAVAAVMAP